MVCGFMCAEEMPLHADSLPLGQPCVRAGPAPQLPPADTPHAPTQHKRAHTVCDLYADWAGPCKAVRETFKKINIEHSDAPGAAPLKFFTVSAGRRARRQCRRWGLALAQRRGL